MGEEKQQQMEDQLEDQMEDSRNPQENNNNNIDDDDEDGAFEQPEETNPEQDLDLGETEMEQDHDLQPEEQIELPANSPSTPPRSPSSPQLIPKLEQPATPPSEAEPSPCPSPCPPAPTPKFPKVRLNALLASDPALKPDAKELTLPDSRLLAPPPLVKPETQAQPEEPHLKPARFMCLPCGIAFSSPSTLEAHQAYYCSHRIKDTDEAGSDKSGAGGSAATTGEVGLSGGSGEPPAKIARTGKQYGCSQCSYSADKKVSLNRHMRMHQTSPAAPTLASLPSLLQNGIPPPGVTPSSLEDSSSQVSKVLRCQMPWIIYYINNPFPSSSKQIATAATVISGSTTSRPIGRTSSTTAVPGDRRDSSHPNQMHLRARGQEDPVPLDPEALEECLPRQLRPESSVRRPGTRPQLRRWSLWRLQRRRQLPPSRPRPIRTHPSWHCPRTRSSLCPAR